MTSMKPQKISQRTMDTVLEEIKSKAPFYVPEWTSMDEEDFGITISKIFAHMSAIVAKRLNTAPQKHFLSFLDMINSSLIPAQPARAPLTFVLSEGASENVLIQSPSQISAQGPDGNPIVFETEKNITATPSKLLSVFSIVKNSDEIFDHKIAINGSEPTNLFDGDNLQSHILYFGDENIFNVKNADIFISAGEMDLEKLDPEKECVKWEYGIKSTKKEKDKEIKTIEWKKFEDFELDKNNLRLIITTKEPIDKVKLNGFESRWIRCLVNESKIVHVKNINLNIANLKLSVAPSAKESISVKQVQGIGDIFYDKLVVTNVNNKIETVDDLLKLDAEQLAQRLKCSRKRAINILEAARKDFLDKTGEHIQTGTEGIFKGVFPDMLFYNNIPLDPTELLYPFGRKPQAYDTFYVGCEDAFSKKEYEVELKFYLVPGRSSSAENIPQLSYEYWDGKSWSSLDNFLSFNEDIKNFIDTDDVDNNIYCSETTNVSPNPKNVIATIYEMPEVKPTTVNGKDNYWIRVRLVGGDYGDVLGSYCQPKIKNLKITYNRNGGEGGEQPEYIFVENNLIFKDCLNKLELKSSFKPFEPLPDNYPTIYFGFDKELKEGPISFFVHIDESFEYPEDFLPRIEWQCLIDVDNGKWEELKVSDETRGFTKSGMVQFVVSEDIKMKGSKLFGSENNRYWMRAVVTDDFFVINSENSPEQEQSPSKGSDVASINRCKEEFEVFNISFAEENARKIPPKVLGFYLNSVWAVQSMTITDEIMGSSNGEQHQIFNLLNTPVINENLWVNEFNTLSEGERKILLENGQDVEEKKDDKGNVVEFWVKWNAVDDFIDSNSEDRHYTIDRTGGQVRFGDGKGGMVPSIGHNNIKATYTTGGGKSGNLAPSKISKLQSSIAFVDEVYNPISSDGGTETEEIDTLIKRAPIVLKHRKRAVALEDFQWLAKEASNKVTKVKILPNFNDEGRYKTGWLTVVIVPKSPESKPMPSTELKRRVETYLKERCPNVMKLKVIQPSYVRVDVSAELITDAIDTIPAIKHEARTKIVDFLHPLTGGSQGKGWDFGHAPCISDIYSIFESIEHVDHVKNVTIELQSEDSKVMNLTDASRIIKLPEYALPFSGEHEITVQWESNKEG